MGRSPSSSSSSALGWKALHSAGIGRSSSRSVAMRWMTSWSAEVSATSDGVTGAERAYAVWNTPGSITMVSGVAVAWVPRRTCSSSLPDSVRANRVTAGATRW